MLFAAACIMQAQLTVSGEKKGITKLSSDSERGIQASLFPVLLCVEVLEGDLKLWTVPSL